MKRITDFFWRTGKKNPAISIGKNDSEDFSKKDPLSELNSDGEIVTRIKNERFEELISELLMTSVKTGVSAEVNSVLVPVITISSSLRRVSFISTFIDLLDFPCQRIVS